MTKRFPILIIGERINSTRKHIYEAIKARNASFIIAEAVTQLNAGAHFLDINCAVTFGDEAQDMDWLMSVMQSGIEGVNICIDSPSYRAIERALQAYKGKGKLMINSITADDKRIEAIIPLAIKYSAKVIALAMDEKGMPDTAASRLDIAKIILEKTARLGFKAEDLYFDLLIRPVATEPNQPMEFLKALGSAPTAGIVNTICGLSNVSFGLPSRGAINSNFMAMAIAFGLNAAIIDPTDKRMISSIRSAEALAGRDEYCMNYIKAYREGNLG